MKKMRVMALLLALLMGAPQVAGAATGEMPEIREMSEAGEREEQGAGAHFALLRADVDPAGTPGMYLVKLEIANLSYEDEDVSFSLDDPDGHVRNADEIAGTLQFYGKTIKQYAFLMRIPVPKKPTDMPLRLSSREKRGGTSAVPHRVCTGRSCTASLHAGGDFAGRSDAGRIFVDGTASCEQRREDDGECHGSRVFTRTRCPRERYD